MGNCGDCKHWNQVPGADCGRCEGISYEPSFFGKVRDTESKAWYSDYEAYDAYFWTKPDFGCILFEPKENPEWN